MPNRVSPHFAWKRNESENERSEIAKKKVSFALKQNGIFWKRNEMIRSEKYRKFCTENTKNHFKKFTERLKKQPDIQGCLDENDKSN